MMRGPPNVKCDYYSYFSYSVGIDTGCCETFYSLKQFQVWRLVKTYHKCNFHLCPGILCHSLVGGYWHFRNCPEEGSVFLHKFGTLPLVYTLFLYRKITT